MAKAPAENHFYNSLRLNDGGLGMTTPDVAYWPLCMVRPRVVRGFRRSVGCGSCINVSGLILERVMLRATMDISAHAISLTSRPRPGQQGHQYSHAPGRPIFHLVLSSRRPRRRVSRIDLTTSSRAPHFARPL